MTKLGRILGRKLSVQLILAVIAAMVTAYASFPLLLDLSYGIVEATLASPEAIAADEERFVWMLQEFVVDNNITIDDLDPLGEWMTGEENIRLTLFANNLIFDSDYDNRLRYAPLPFDEGATPADGYVHYLDKQYISTLIKEYSSNFYTLTLADGTIVNAIVHSENYLAYYLWAYYISLGVAVFIFILICLISVRIKMGYLRTLSRELTILEGGDLHFALTEKGNDELFELAQGINQLRLSLLAKKQEEEEGVEAHQKLMTALAHDLRTPLTSLIGYLELLLLKHGNDGEQRHYLMATKRKAFQIREMSDKLFEYFLTSEKTAETYNKELIKTKDLVTSLIDNQLFDLESGGFAIKLYTEADTFVGECLIDAEFLQRVLDNTISNIRKYADRPKGLEVLVFETDSFLHIEFVNALDSNAYSGESTSLGLRTCTKIMQEHGGNYQGYEQGERFISRMILPLYKEEGASLE